MTALSSTRHLPPVRRRPRRLRDRRRRRRARARGAGDGAVARGATILGEVLGAASTADAHHITAPSPGGAGAVHCMELALADAGLAAGRHRPHQRPRHVDAAQRRRRGRGRSPRCSARPGPPVTSTKGVTGHALGAAGAHRGGRRACCRSQHAAHPAHRRATTTADPELPADRPRHGEPRPWTRVRRCRTASASAATTAAWSSAPALT